MLNIRKICWGIMGAIAIGAIEPIAWAAMPELEPVVVQDTRLAAITL
jgi:hypothetical protein